jgi:hypothetical protein
MEPYGGGIRVLRGPREQYRAGPPQRPRRRPAGRRPTRAPRPQAPAAAAAAAWPRRRRRRGDCRSSHLSRCRPAGELSHGGGAMGPHTGRRPSARSPPSGWGRTGGQQDRSCHDWDRCRASPAQPARLALGRPAAAAAAAPPPSAMIAEELVDANWLVLVLLVLLDRCWCQFCQSGGSGLDPCESRSLRTTSAASDAVIGQNRAGRGVCVAVDARCPHRPAAVRRWRLREAVHRPAAAAETPAADTVEALAATTMASYIRHQSLSPSVGPAKLRRRWRR